MNSTKHLLTLFWKNIHYRRVAAGFPVYEHVWLLFFRKLVTIVCIVLSFVYLTTLLQVHRRYSINEFYRNKLYLFVSFRNQNPGCYRNQDRIQFWSQNTYLLTYGAEPFLRSHQLCSHSRILSQNSELLKKCV
jgi:hypothetical protein